MAGEEQLIWAKREWRSEAETWIESELKRKNIAIRGPIEQPHVRPRATVLRVPTDSGSIYFKANLPGFSHEPALATALYRWRPDCMIEVLATDEQRGWMLMRDGGTPLRGLIQASGDLSHLYRVFELYADVQIELAERVPELLKLTTDRRLSNFPQEYARLLTDKDSLLIGQSDCPTLEQHQQLWALVPRVAEICERLAQYNIPESIQHDDLHDNNVFVKDGRYHLADWEDSVVSHPFCSLVVGLRSPAFTHKLDENGPELRKLRDTYLKPWTHFEPFERLLEALDLAMPLGKISRALTWHQTVLSIEPQFRAEYATFAPGWLLGFLESQMSDPS